MQMNMVCGELWTGVVCAMRSSAALPGVVVEVLFGNKYMVSMGFEACSIMKPAGGCDV